MTAEHWAEQLADRDKKKRLDALRALKRMELRGETAAPVRSGDVNNHIHTTYSFSPYTPSAAAWLAYRAGLETAGIMDHDTLGGAAEFAAAGHILELPVTSGVELRVSFRDTPYANRRINNPDQAGNAYMALHAVPSCARETVSQFLEPVRMARGERNRAMTARINEAVQQTGVKLNYERDVLPRSQAAEGGAVTERHLLYALAESLTARFGRGGALLDALAALQIEPAGPLRTRLSDSTNPHYAFDLLGVLKSEFVAAIYIDADEAECPPVQKVIALARSTGAVAAYAYLGDVGVSVTGDKRAQTFEDAYLDEWIPYIKRLGFTAVTYMPSRNTAEQLARLRALCKKHDLMEISGEDINSPRQPFVCSAARDPAYAHLKEAAYALVGSERHAAYAPERALFSETTRQNLPDLWERVQYYSFLGRGGAAGA